MSFYDYKCDRCGYMSTFEHSMSTVLAAKHECNTCKVELRRLFATPKIKIAFTAGHDPSTGQNFNSQAARDSYISRSGLVKDGTN